MFGEDSPRRPSTHATSVPRTPESKAPPASISSEVDPDQFTTERLREADRRGDPHAQAREEARASVDHHPVDVPGDQANLVDQGFHG